MVKTSLPNMVPEYKLEKKFEGVACEADFIVFYSRMPEMMAEIFPPTDF